MKPVRMNIVGRNGNAFGLLGAFAKNARQQGWTEQAIAAVQDEAMKGNYDHVLKTLISYTIPPEPE